MTLRDEAVPLLPNHMGVHIEQEKRLHERSPGNIVLRLVASLYLWIAIPAFLIISFTVQVLLWVLLWPLFLVSGRQRHLIQGRTFRFFQVASSFYLNPFWRMKIVSPPPEGFRPDGSCIVMCNHMTQADPWIVSRALWPWELKWVYKADIKKIPFAGCAIQMAGDIPLYFTRDKGGWGTRPGAVQEMMARVEEMATKYDIGTFIFPEGTRSRTGRLQPFKDGFFKFALEHKKTILPCAAHNNPALWPLGATLFGAGTVYFMFGTPVHPEPSDTVESLKRRVRDQIIELIKRSPVYDEELDAPLSEMASTRGQGLMGEKV